VKDEEAEAEPAYKKGRKEEAAAAQHGDAVASPKTKSSSHHFHFHFHFHKNHGWMSSRKF
jgi:hypothetical protein